MLNVLAEVSLAAPTTTEVRAYIQNGAAAFLSAACARVNEKGWPFLDRGSIDKAVGEAYYFLIQRATSNTNTSGIRGRKSESGQNPILSTKNFRK